MDMDLEVDETSFKPLFLFLNYLFIYDCMGLRFCEGFL